jgi:hypothetical protein
MRYEHVWLLADTGMLSLDQAARRTRELAHHLGCGIQFQFNGVTIHITEDSKIVDVEEEYQNGVKLIYPPGPRATGAR